MLADLTGQTGDRSTKRERALTRNPAKLTRSPSLAALVIQFMITKEVEVENLRDGNIILVGDWANNPGIKMRVHRVMKYDDGCGDILYEVLLSNVTHPNLKMESVVYPKGYRKTLLF